MYGLINESGLLMIKGDSLPEEVRPGEYLISGVLAGPWLGELTPCSDIPSEAQPGQWRFADNRWQKIPDPPPPPPEPDPPPSFEEMNQKISELEDAFDTLTDGLVQT